MIIETKLLILTTKPDCSVTVPFRAFRILVGGTVPFRSVPDFSNHPKWCALCSLEAATVARAMADGDGGSRSSIVRSLSSLWKSSEEKEESWGLVRRKGEITRL